MFQASPVITSRRPSWAVEQLPFDTVPKMFWQRVETYGNQVMMRQKCLGIWQSYTWNEVAEIVSEMGAGLVALGFEPGEVVSVLSNTNREWVWTDLSVLSMGGVCNGVYPTDAASQLEYLCDDSSSVYLFAEDEEQLDKYLSVRERLPKIRKVIVFDMEGLQGFDDPDVISLVALRALGRTHLRQNANLVNLRLATRGPEDLAVLVYTSGTTGKPKGAMLLHRNICAAVSSCGAAMFEDAPYQGERVAFLPLCHIAERLVGEYMAIFRRDVINFVENPETVFENLREIQPTVFFAVPRVWEKIYSSVSIILKEAGQFQQLAYRWALAIGALVANASENGPSWHLRVRHWFARKLVLENVRRLVGLNKVDVALTGAAPISPELIRWYQSLGIPLREAWGMTETAAGGTVTPRGACKPGSIGQPGPGVAMRISERGEILVRGPSVFAGYLNMPEKTAEAVIDGWLHTGDVGKVDEDGYFYITDRMKDIIITAGGKNITPSEWENQLKFSLYVTDAVVIGDRRPFMSCLVMLDEENVAQWAQDRDVHFSDFKSLCRAPEVIALIGEEVARVNKEFARVEQIREYRLIEERLTAEDEELTPTMKLKRSLINKKYSTLIEDMYASKAAA